MEDDSREFSDGDSGLDEFEESRDNRGTAPNKKGGQVMTNQKYDEAYELSQDLSMAESFDGREKKNTEKERKLRNDKYDEAVDVSMSVDQSAMAFPKNEAKPVSNVPDDAKLLGAAKQMLSRDNEQSKSQSVLNKPFDEALEFSHSGSDDSVDTRMSDRKGRSKAAEAKTSSAPSAAGGRPAAAALQPSHVPSQQSQPAQRAPAKKTDDEESSSEEEGEQDESYENLEGAYNPRDYQHLNVTAEVRDLFQYIERYKPHEVELESTLKSFIPEYIPAIGEMDAFIKVPRPDKKDDDLGLKYLDEPSSTQSDPTVLELQLRAMSKKLQYGDIVVRSIENAHKSPSAIDKWIQNIADLHRSKPPPQVHYRRNMPDIDKLLDVWPEEFEAALETLKLPSPDLDLSLADYTKTLCAILDIPTYENPIESLHLMFTLFMEFRNNPHFQARETNMADRTGAEYGAADVMKVNQGHK